MARLKFYTVHVRAWSASPDHDAVLVREGFCWPAFLFSAFWALRHRMWFAAALMLAALLGLAAIGDVLDLDATILQPIGFALAVWIGFEANDWRRDALRRRGYAEIGVVAAPDRARAEHRALELRAGAGG
ncbi:MAG: DUF2628 domain-containing protein [Rhodospirillales bacterium]